MNDINSAGPAPNFRHERSAGMRGTKLSLFEGGIRLPFIVWGSDVPKGTTDSTSVISALDLLPSFARLGGISNGFTGDGEDLSMVLSGRQTSRKKDISGSMAGTKLGLITQNNRATEVRNLLFAAEYGNC